MHQDNPFPSVADLFYLLTYVLIAAGIFLIISLFTVIYVTFMRVDEQ